VRLLNGRYLRPANHRQSAREILFLAHQDNSASIRRLDSLNADLITSLVRSFRSARTARLKFLNDLHREEEDYEFISRKLLIENEVWIAELNDVVAGFIAFHDDWVNQLYVAPQFQRRGIGRDLLAIAKRGNASLQLWVFEVNEPAIRFYQQQGFRIVERTDGAANEAKMPDLRMVWEASHTTVHV